MTERERFQQALHFRRPDRLPVVEWATWWDLTIKRWEKEGLPEGLPYPDGISDYLGLDRLRQVWINATSAATPLHPESRGVYPFVIRDEADYEAVLPTLYSDEVLTRETLERMKKEQSEGAATWITLEGFFWFPRRLLGVEAHMYAFYDQPELIRRINGDLLAYNKRVLERVYDYFTPDFMTVAEDMSYNHGVMCSKKLFDSFIGPYYRRLTPLIRERGTVPFVDSDGDITDLVGWMEEVGVEGFLPLERMAGVDVASLRKQHPRLRLLGAFDKTVMEKGEEAMRAEFERLLPVMRQGGFVPAVDHQTPPQCSLENYMIYKKLLCEYALRAVEQSV
ncbi:MAG: hypothetical protein IK083_03960 [Abditibacteriota bacterium]|nr:hypothetical protein [Abditibacteriota bacterium]